MATNIPSSNGSSLGTPLQTGTNPISTTAATNFTGRLASTPTPASTSASIPPLTAEERTQYGTDYRNVYNKAIDPQGKATDAQGRVTNESDFRGLAANAVRNPPQLTERQQQIAKLLFTEERNKLTTMYKPPMMDLAGYAHVASTPPPSVMRC